MKKLFLPLLCLLMGTTACFDDELQDLKEQIDEIKDERIRSVQEQMTSLTTSVLDLSKIDLQLNDYITSLQNDAAELEEAITLAENKIESQKKELQDDLSSSAAEILAQLESYKTSLSVKLSEIDGTIAALQASDVELDGSISALKTYVDEKLADNTDVEEWATVTFATLEMHNSLSLQVNTIRAEIETLNSTVGQLIDAEVSDALSGIVDEIKPSLEDFVEDRLSEYENGLQTSLYSLETDMKAWVNERLSSYSTVSSVDAKILALKKELENTLTTQQQYLQNLINNMEQRLVEKIETNASLIASLRTDADAIDAAVAEVIRDIAANSEAISQNADRIIENASDISANADDIQSNSTLIAANKALIEKNTILVNANKELINANQGAIAENSAAIAENMLAVSRNASDIASNASLISTNATAILNNSAAISDNAEAIEALKIQLEDTKAEITASYKSAIAASINTLDGKLTGKIAEEVEALNERITEEVAAVNSSVKILEGRVTTCENDIKSLKTSVYALQLEVKDVKSQIAEILSMIQSVTFVPAFDDGYATMYYSMADGAFVPGVSVLKYDVRPVEAAAALSDIWQDALNVKAVYTRTRAAGDFCDLEVKGVSVEGSFLTLTVSGAALSEDFFTSELAASISLVISNDISEYASEYVRLMPYAPEEDEVFKSWLLANHDANNDGELSDEEALTVTSISFTDEYTDIASLDGIERLVNLTHLDARGQNLSSLDLTDNKKLRYVNVSGNALRRLDVSGCEALETLDCSDNELQSLDVSDLQALVSLYCHGNDLQAISLKPLTVLRHLDCRDNEISSLDLTHNKELLTLDCSGNRLYSLSLSENSGLTSLICRTNNLSQLYVTGCAALETLDCRENLLRSLNLASCVALETLDCSDNQIEALDLVKNDEVTVLNCSDNALSSLVVSNMEGLLVLDCSGNASMDRLWLKDVMQEAAMTIAKDKGTAIHYNSGGIYIPDAKLKAYLVNSYDDDFDGEISIVESENVVSVNCANMGVSNLTGLEVCTNIESLNCSGNNISVIDCHTLTKLRTLSVYGNPVEKLEISNCAALTGLYLMGASVNAVSGNIITINGFSQSESLEINMTATPFTTLKVIKSAVLKTLDVEKNENLTEFYFSGNTALTSVSLSPMFVYLSGSGCTSLEQIDVTSLVGLEELYVYDCRLSSLDVTKNHALAVLNCSDNLLTSLDVDNNPELVTLNCSKNSMTRIKLTNNTRLQYLNVADNDLMSLNVKTNSALKTLLISNNVNMQPPFLTYNTALETLRANGLSIVDIDLLSNNKLQHVNLSNCKNLTTVYVGDWVSKTPRILFDSGLKMVNQEGGDMSADAIGALLTVDGVSGVLYEYNGKKMLLSAEETQASWSSAKTWCSSLGTGWYLPSVDELKGVYNKRTFLNTTLSKYAFTTFGTGGYWSSTGTGSTSAYILRFDSGDRYHYDKSYTEAVRAVRAL